MTIKEYKDYAVKKLSSTSQSPLLDVEVFFEFFLGINKTQQLLNPSRSLIEKEINLLEKALEKRLLGYPVAYITGHKEFYGYDFLVSQAVLIPKPDTEILVEKAINIILKKISEEDKTLYICDMCTGSGCIGLSILLELIHKHNIPIEKLPKMYFVDISSAALEIARLNAWHLFKELSKTISTELLFEKMNFIQSNLFEKIDENFDIVLSNPPYIPSMMVNELLMDGRREPRIALDGDVDVQTGSESISADGLSIIRVLIRQLLSHLVLKGSFILEAGEYNIFEAEKILKSQGFSSEIYYDLEGQPRGVTSIYNGC